MDSFGFIMTSLLSLKLGLVEASCSMQVSCFLGAGTHFFCSITIGDGQLRIECMEKITKDDASNQGEDNYNSF